jgi:hypothetical protein
VKRRRLRSSLDFLSIYSFNPTVADPDWVQKGIPLNVGMLYQVLLPLVDHDRRK